MSNCYTTFHFELPLPNAAVVEEVETLLGKFPGWMQRGDDETKDDFDALCSVFEDFAEYEELGFDWDVRSFGTGEDMKHVLSIYADESGNTVHAGNVIEWLLPKLDINLAGFQYACYGDGENGGGAMFVNMVDGKPVSQFMNTWTWLEEATK